MWTKNILLNYQRYIGFTARHYSKTRAATKIVPANNHGDIHKFEIGQKYHGFTVKDMQDIAEFRLTAVCLEHDVTKSEYVHFFREDSNNAFAVSFRTTPMDSTGLPHILEHTVLCGSKRYPVRDPFFKMLNRSLATFMNAMTGPDYTFYPYSTQNETDFHNLQKIYLDAVFRPNINLLDFMQEGWRLENANPNDKNSNIIIKGVVFNEMKGVFSENENIMNQKMLNVLLPDHTYGYVSGGDPLHIPEMTWDNLKQFHKDHYHPSNANFYSYGNFPLLPSLEYVHKEYLSTYDRIDVNHTLVPKQNRWTEPKNVHIKCRFDTMGEPIEKQNTISISLLMADITEVYETFVLQFVTELLIRGPNSPFYKALIEPKISGGYTQSTGYEPHIRDTVFTLGLQKLEAEKFAEVVNIFDQTIDQVIANGFEKSQIESVLHRYELGIKHQTANFGLHLMFGVIPLKNHTGDIIKQLRINSLIDQLKTNMQKDSKYLQSYIQKYFKDNTHRLVLTMSPDVDYDKNYSKLEADVLNSKVSKLSQEEKAEIYERGLELQKEQGAQQNTDLLPTLKLADIKGDVERHSIEKLFIGSVPMQICNVNTNGITYFRGILSTFELTQEQEMLLPLFCFVISKLGTNNMNHLEFDSMVNRKTMGLNFSVHVGESLHHLHKYEPGIHISSYCLDSNISSMWNLWNEIFNITELKDVQRFEMLVQMYMANLTNGIVDYGHEFAMNAAEGLVSGSAFHKDLLNGLQHITYMKRLVSTSNYVAILSELSEIARIIFNKNKLRACLNVSEGSIPEVKKSLETFVKKLPGNSLGKPNDRIYVTPKIWHPEDLVHCQHHVLNIPINFCSKSVLTVPYTDSNHAKLRVLARLLSAKYLHPELRERQGAYGGGARISLNGVFTFYTYRDPRNFASLDVFDKTAIWLKEELTKLKPQDILEAKLGVFQKVDSPLAPSEKGVTEFQRGLTADILQRHRAEIMSVSLDSLVDIGNQFLGERREVLEGKVVLGPQDKDFDVTKRQGEIWTVMNNE